MKITNYRILGFSGKAAVWIATFALIACGSLGEVQAQSTRTRISRYSGFLGDYSKLKRSRQLKGAMSYENPSKKLGHYDKFIIDLVVVHFAPNAKGIGVDPIKVQQVADYFHRELWLALSMRMRYQVVNTPGPGVLRLRMAITDIKTTVPIMNIHPGTKLLGQVSGLGLGGASMEGEAVDSQTGERVLAVVDMRRGAFNPLPSGAGFDEVGHAKEVVRYWVKRFVGRVDKAHGYKK